MIGHWHLVIGTWLFVVHASVSDPTPETCNGVVKGVLFDISVPAASALLVMRRIHSLPTRLVTDPVSISSVCCPLGRSV